MTNQQDEPDTNCPLCAEPLGDEKLFHLECAKRENADAE